MNGCHVYTDGGADVTLTLVLLREIVTVAVATVHCVFVLFVVASSVCGWLMLS